LDIEIPFLKSLLVEPKKAFAGQPAGLSILRSVVFVAIASMLMGMTRLADLQVNQPDVFSQLEIDFPYFMAACALAVTGIFFASAGISYGVAQGIDATGSFAQQTYFSSVYFAAFGEALAILGLLGGTKNPLAGLVVTALFWLVLCLGLSIRVAFLSPQDGIVAAANGLVESRATRDTVNALTETNSVIIVDRADKIFFPDRRVLYPLRDDATYALMPRIALRVPLYYYGITLPQTDVDYLNGDRLAKLGLKIDVVRTFRIETLYRISQRD